MATTNEDFSSAFGDLPDIASFAGAASTSFTGASGDFATLVRTVGAFVRDRQLGPLGQRGEAAATLAASIALYDGAYRPTDEDVRLVVERANTGFSLNGRLLAGLLAGCVVDAAGGHTFSYANVVSQYSGANPSAPDPTLFGQRPEFSHAGPAMARRTAVKASVTGDGLFKALLNKGANVADDYAKNRIQIASSPDLQGGDGKMGSRFDKPVFLVSTSAPKFVDFKSIKGSRVGPELRAALAAFHGSHVVASGDAFDFVDRLTMYPPPVDAPDFPSLVDSTESYLDQYKVAILARSWGVPEHPAPRDLVLPASFASSLKAGWASLAASVLTYRWNAKRRAGLPDAVAPPSRAVRVDIMSRLGVLMGQRCWAAAAKALPGDAFSVARATAVEQLGPAKLQQITISAVIGKLDAYKLADPPCEVVEIKSGGGTRVANAPNFAAPPRVLIAGNPALAVVGGLAAAVTTPLISSWVASTSLPEWLPATELLAASRANVQFGLDDLWRSPAFGDAYVTGPSVYKSIYTFDESLDEFGDGDNRVIKSPGCKVYDTAGGEFRNHRTFAKLCYVQGRATRPFCSLFMTANLMGRAATGTYGDDAMTVVALPYRDDVLGSRGVSYVFVNCDASKMDLTASLSHVTLYNKQLCKQLPRAGPLGAVAGLATAYAEAVAGQYGGAVVVVGNQMMKLRTTPSGMQQLFYVNSTNMFLGMSPVVAACDQVLDEMRAEYGLVSPGSGEAVASDFLKRLKPCLPAAVAACQAINGLRVKIDGVGFFEAERSSPALLKLAPGRGRVCVPLWRKVPGDESNGLLDYLGMAAVLTHDADGEPCITGVLRPSGVCKMILTPPGALADDGEDEAGLPVDERNGALGAVMLALCIFTAAAFDTMRREAFAYGLAEFKIAGAYSGSMLNALNADVDSPTGIVKNTEAITQVSLLDFMTTKGASLTSAHPGAQGQARVFGAVFSDDEDTSNAANAAFAASRKEKKAADAAKKAAAPTFAAATARVVAEAADAEATVDSNARAPLPKPTVGKSGRVLMRAQPRVNVSVTRAGNVPAHVDLTPIVTPANFAAVNIGVGRTRLDASYAFSQPDDALFLQRCVLGRTLYKVFSSPAQLSGVFDRPLAHAAISAFRARQSAKIVDCMNPARLDGFVAASARVYATDASTVQLVATFMGMQRVLTDAGKLKPEYAAFDEPHNDQALRRLTYSSEQFHVLGSRRGLASMYRGQRISMVELPHSENVAIVAPRGFVNLPRDGRVGLVASLARGDEAREAQIDAMADFAVGVVYDRIAAHALLQDVNNPRAIKVMFRAGSALVQALEVLDQAGRDELKRQSDAVRAAQKKAAAARLSAAQFATGDVHIAGERLDASEEEDNAGPEEGPEDGGSVGDRAPRSVAGYSFGSHDGARDGDRVYEGTPWEEPVDDRVRELMLEAGLNPDDPRDVYQWESYASDDGSVEDRRAFEAALEFVDMAHELLAREGVVEE